MSEEQELPPGWKKAKLGDICDISGDSVTLHPTKGVNPFITTCPMCGKDTGLVMLGIRDFVVICNKCGAHHIGGVNPRDGVKSCHGCGETGNWRREPIKEGSKIPADLCDDCRKVAEVCNKAVDEGGIFFQCKKCGAQGAISKDSDLSKKVREQTKTPTGPVGIKLSECPYCDDSPEKECKGEPMNPDELDSTAE